MNTDDTQKLIMLTKDKNDLLGKINDNLKLLVLCVAVGVCFGIWAWGSL